MGFRKDFKEKLIADLSILDVIRKFKPESLYDQKSGQEFPLKSDGSMSIRCPKPTHEDNSPSCTINITDRGKFKANTGHCFSCPENQGFSSLDLAIQWLEYRKEVEPPPPDRSKGDRNYYKKVEKVLDVFGLDRSRYCEYNTDHKRENVGTPFFTRDELSALDINSFIQEENKRNMIHQYVRLEDYVNFSLLVKRQQGFIDKQIQVSDFFYKDPVKKTFVFTGKVPDEKQKVFLAEARNLLIAYGCEMANGDITLDFTYKDIIKNRAFEIYQDKKSLVSPELDKNMRDCMPEAMKAMDVFGKVIDVERAKQNAHTATEKLHEAIRHNLVLCGIKGECCFTLEEITNRRYQTYFNNVTKKQNTPLPSPAESIQSIFTENKSFNQYTYSADVFLDEKKVRFSYSLGTTDQKHFPPSDKSGADFRYSTEKSNVPLFQSEQEYNFFHSIYDSLVNNYNSYQQRFFQLVEENSRTYRDVNNNPFTFPVCPEKMKRIAENDSILLSLTQQRDDIMSNVKSLIQTEYQKMKEYSAESVKCLKAKEQPVPFVIKNGNLYSEYIETAEDLWKKDKNFFESLIADRISSVREECNRRIDKIYAQTTSLTAGTREDNQAVRFYLRYRELQKQNAVPPEAEQYRGIIEKGKEIYNNNVFLSLYSKKIGEFSQKLDLVKSAEIRLGNMQKERREKEVSSDCCRSDCSEQSGMEQE